MEMYSVNSMFKAVECILSISISQEVWDPLKWNPSNDRDVTQCYYWNIIENFEMSLGIELIGIVHHPTVICLCVDVLMV